MNDEQKGGISKMLFLAKDAAESLKPRPTEKPPLFPIPTTATEAMFLMAERRRKGEAK